MIILYFGTAGGCKEPMIYQYSIAPHFGWKIVETVHHENRNGCRNDEIVALSLDLCLANPRWFRGMVGMWTCFAQNYFSAHEVVRD